MLPVLWRRPSEPVPFAPTTSACEPLPSTACFDAVIDAGCPAHLWVLHSGDQRHRGYRWPLQGQRTILPMTMPSDERNDRPLSLFRRLIRAGQVPQLSNQCHHLQDAHADPEPRTPGCEEHQPQDGAWVHLRLCLTCGHVGCCDSSKPRHATAHHQATGHPVIRSFEPTEDWRWCYVHELLG
jgi:Zn-finger in ubiquitin-hydrolases and other protein